MLNQKVHENQRWKDYVQIDCKVSELSQNVCDASPTIEDILRLMPRSPIPTYHVNSLEKTFSNVAVTFLLLC